MKFLSIKKAVVAAMLGVSLVGFGFNANIAEAGSYTSGRYTVDTSSFVVTEKSSNRFSFAVIVYDGNGNADTMYFHLYGKTGVLTVSAYPNDEGYVVGNYWYYKRTHSDLENIAVNTLHMNGYD